jgi:hypothetical protein
MGWRQAQGQVKQTMRDILLELKEIHLVIGTDINAILDILDKSNKANYNPHTTKALHHII